MSRMRFNTPCSRIRSSVAPTSSSSFFSSFLSSAWAARPPRPSTPRAAVETRNRLRSLSMVRPPSRGLALATFLPNSLERLIVVLDDLGHQFQELPAGLLQHALPGG